MKKKLLLIIMVIFSIVITSFPVGSADFADNVGKDEIPYGEFEPNFKVYEYKSFDMMTEDEAVAAGVPEGYSGYVLKLVGGAGGVSVGLDLTQYRIKDVESITFRIYCPAGTKNNGVRITDSSKDAWIMLADPGATEEWVEVVLSEKENFNTSAKSFSVFDDGNGYFKRVNFVIRHDGSDDAVVYIDSITVKLKAVDTTAPVITYNGPDVIETSEGRDFSLDLTVTDDRDGAITPEYIWSDGALDESGLLKVGEHTCTVKATDEAGNSSEISVTVKVGAKDTTAPVIDLGDLPEDIVVLVGTKPMFSFSATDDFDEVELEVNWSEGTFDERGRFVEGYHFLELYARDKTGNHTSVDIYINVVREITEENIIQE